MATTTPKPTAKDTREPFHMRIRPEDRSLIDHAAELAGKNRTDFVLDAARIAHGVAPVEKAPCERLVDDHDARCRFVILVPEIAAGKKRDPQQIKIAVRHRGVMHIEVSPGRDAYPSTTMLFHFPSPKPSGMESE